MQSANTQENEVQYPEGATRVLDHGFVRLVEMMGSDTAVVQAARVSYGRGTKSVHEDEGLIRYLLRHRHTTPFEMVEFKFHCRMPIFVARQWIRHRTANVNERSARYSEMPEIFYQPTPEMLTTQSAQNKQGGTGAQIAEAEELAATFPEDQAQIYESYQNYLQHKMRRELARINLPVSLYTEWYWKIDLHNLFHFLALRLDSHAQYEIRVFAEAMAAIVKEKVPVSWRAFEDYTLKAEHFSALELGLIKRALSGEELTEAVLEEAIVNKLERKEFTQKLERLEK